MAPLASVTMGWEMQKINRFLELLTGFLMEKEDSDTAISKTTGAEDLENHVMHSLQPRVARSVPLADRFMFM